MLGIITDEERGEQIPLMRDGSSQSDHMDQAESFYVIQPRENVYSFYFFSVPMERKQHGTSCTLLVAFTAILIVVNFMMQFGLLFIAGDSVEEETRKYYDGIVRLGEPPWYYFVSFAHAKLREEQSSCRDSDSLCFPTGNNGQVTCMPPSLSLLGQWDEMDLDRDGIWSKAEAENQSSRSRLECKYNVDTLVLFSDIVADLYADPRLTNRLHPNISSGSSVHKAYLDWYMGDAMLCMYGDQDMCGNIFEMGIFDAALRQGASNERGLKDLNTAKEYCHTMLSHKCESMFPGTYRVWKATSGEMCGKNSFSPLQYTDPSGDPNKMLLKVDFEQNVEYEKAHTWAFMGFVVILLMIFLCLMYDEWKMIYRYLLWCNEHPPTKDGDRCRWHRLCTLIITVLRLVLWMRLLCIGTVFITSGTDYVNLIFDAVSLLFIIEIDEILFRTLLRGPLREAHLDNDKVLIQRGKQILPVLVIEMLTLACLISAVLIVALCYYKGTLVPVRNALQCACLKEGAACYEASRYTKAWWTDYWLSVMPAASAQIDVLVGG